MNSVPLADALPWESISPPSHGPTILLTDSIETDGRFLLYTVASQYLSNVNAGAHNAKVRPSAARRAVTSTSKEVSSGGLNRKVVWVSCDSLLEKHVVAALKKIGCDTASLPSVASLASSPLQRQSQAGNEKWHFISVPQILKKAVLQSDSMDEEKDIIGTKETADVTETCAKELCKEIRSVVSSNKQPSPLASPVTNTEETESNCANESAACPLIVLDNVSSLAETLGEMYTYALIQQIRGILRSAGLGCLLMRSSNELQDDTDTGTISTMLANERSTAWVGLGGQDSGRTSTTSRFENGLLIEIADCIIDVLPLQSGFSHEAHGRIILTERLGGRGWTQQEQAASSSRHNTNAASSESGRTSNASISSSNKLKRNIFNFVCSDSQVKAIHLRARA
jgi:hypothetical protein